VLEPRGLFRAEAGIVRLFAPRGKPVDWSPARWGGDLTEAFAEAPQEFRPSDRLRFTGNNYPAGRRNCTMATVAAIDPEKCAMTVTLDDGTSQDLDFRRVADRHVRSRWVGTIHSSQGATAERVIAHVEAFRANTVDARSVYVAISRARFRPALP
jgi:ATP-dependent exoDNAse (exonuclease V) alpha subunit